MAPAESRRAVGLRWSLAALGGGSTALSFAPHHVIVLLPLGVALVTLCCTGARLRVGAVAGGLFGVALMLAHAPWLRVIGTDAWIAVAVLEAFFFALLGAGLALVTRLAAWPLWAAGLWVAVELARASVPFGGFPWGRLAFATVDTPLASYARLGGTALVTAAVVLASNLALWSLLALAREWQARRRLSASGIAAALTAVLVAVGIAAGGTIISLTSPPSGRSVIALVQGGVPQAGLGAYSQARAVLDNHAGATTALARAVRAGGQPAPDVVIWPESSTDIDPFADAAAAATISAAVGEVGAPTLVGAVVNDRNGARRNIGVVWDPVTGPGSRYVKRHAVPFGEYIPLRGLLAGFIDRLDQIPQDQASGSTPGVLRLAGVLLGDVICFEVAYDGLVRDVVSAGAQLVVVQTNNATYLGTGQLEQQWQISRLQAIQTGRVVAVAATTGISGFATPDGKVLARSTAGGRAVLVREVALHDQLTLGVRFGGSLELGLALLGIGSAVVAGARRRRRTTVAVKGRQGVRWHDEDSGSTSGARRHPDLQRDRQR